MRRSFTALAFNGISGDYAEFGCCGGLTFCLAYHEMRTAGAPRHLWAFDSFRGLPASAGPEDEHPVWTEGGLSMSIDDFNRVCAERGLPREAYSVVAGYYQDTLDRIPAHTEQLPNDIGLAYIDCDMYSSTSTVLRYLAPLFKNGMIVAFDDYFCASSSALAGERRALVEFLGQNDRFHFLPYVQFGWHGMSFMLEDRQLLEGSPRLTV